jgi:hypothetical protein
MNPEDKKAQTMTIQTAERLPTEQAMANDEPAVIVAADEEQYWPVFSIDQFPMIAMQAMVNGVGLECCSP